MSVRKGPSPDKASASTGDGRLPQRWVTILAVSSAIAVAAGSLADPMVGVPVWLGTVGLLHQIMD
ncbi:MAG: hypothetical protein JWQ95_2540 [Sphaerisporangium sp.]|nr:hypothetical protein [Sphaerisporangium sp.]